MFPVTPQRFIAFTVCQFIAFIGVLTAAALFYQTTAHDDDKNPSRVHPIRVLCYSNTAFYRHPEIPTINRWLVLEGDQRKIQIDVTEHAKDLTPAALENYDVLLFNNANQLAEVIPWSERKSIENWFKSGKSIVALHATLVKQQDWPWLMNLGGCDFDSDSDFMKAKILVDPAAKNHPTVKGFGNQFWYSADWTNHTRSVTGLDGVQVLLRVDEQSYDPVREYFRQRDGKPMGADHPIAWTREIQGGRFFYTELGHDLRSLDTEFGKQHLFEGIKWAAAKPKKISTAIPSEIKSVTPDSETSLATKKNDDEFLPNQNRLPTPPPKDAVVLFNGTDTVRFVSMTGEKIDWPIKNQTLVSSKGKRRTNHIVSTFHFRDADIHAEFMLPKQGPGNSGLYIHGNYEMQIFNSAGKKKVGANDIGALYGFAPPLVNAARPPETWQVYDIRYRAPLRDSDRQITKSGSITAWLNGQLVQKGTLFTEPRSSYHPFRHGVTEFLRKIDAQKQKTMIGPLFIQDHDNPVRFRNIWVRPLDRHYLTYPSQKKQNGP